jgi:hypothetical protein
MFRYRLRTLLIVLAVGPLFIGGIFHGRRIILEARERARNTPCDSGPRWPPPPVSATSP